jgi:hypothetical protein
MSFDAQEIAEQALAKGEDPLAVLIGQYGGFTSVCWENMAGTGTFQSEDAQAATEQVLAWIRDHTAVTVREGQRLVLVVDQFTSAEDAHRLKSALEAQGTVVIAADMLRTAYVVDEPAGVEVADDEPRLGCATTSHLIDELAARVEVARSAGEDWPAYRTVDG